MDRKPIPGWAWVFAVVCGAVPVFALGGAIPGALGFGAASGCITVARDSSHSLAVRVAICASLTCMCWVLFVALVGGVAATQSQ